MSAPYTRISCCWSTLSALFSTTRTFVLVVVVGWLGGWVGARGTYSGTHAEGVVGPAGRPGGSVCVGPMPRAACPAHMHANGCPPPPHPPNQALTRTSAGSLEQLLRRLYGGFASALVQGAALQTVGGSGGGGGGGSVGVRWWVGGCGG